MKHKTTTLLGLLIALWMCLPLAGYAETADGRGFHNFLSLPFDTATPDTVEQALLEHYGVGWDPNYTHYLLSGVTEFEQEFSVSFDFNPNQIGITRIVLSPADRYIWSDNPEEFAGMLKRDIADFIALDERITQKYGTPEWQFFRVNGEKYNPVKRNPEEYMFADGQWDAEQMLKICEEQKSIKAFAAWGNVVLEYWVYDDERPNRKSKSSITLFYYDFLNDWDSSSTIDFPSAADN